MNPSAALPPGVEVLGAPTTNARLILTRPAVDFVAFLERGFRPRRAEIIARRAARRAAFDEGDLPDFVPETAYLRADNTWRVAALPADLRDRRAEITLPPEQAALHAAMSAGATSLMVDFEDGCAPAWTNLVEGQFNLREAVRRMGAAGAPRAALILRPRGWHLDEPRLLIDGQPCAGALFDFALYLFHNAAALAAYGSGPYYCLPKLQSRLEARLWNDILRLAEQRLSLPHGTIRVACMVETLEAAFEMDEILHELRDHAIGLVAGHHDYAISMLRVPPLPRDVVGTAGAGGSSETPDMGACKALLVATCRRRGAFAMGTASDRIPIGSDPAANEAVSDRVRRHAADAASLGFDGTRVMHPGMVAIARAAFEQAIAGGRAAVAPIAPVQARDLLTPWTAPPLDEDALHEAVETGVRYAGAWLGGAGCVPIRNRMTDAASASLRVARIRRRIESSAAALPGGPHRAPRWLTDRIDAVLAALRDDSDEPGGHASRYPEGARLFEALCVSKATEARLGMTGFALPD